MNGVGRRQMTEESSASGQQGKTTPGTRLERAVAVAQY